MKKFTALISMLLALAMLIPCALAETTDAYVIRISDPSVGAEGVTLTIDGLALQMALCESSDQELMQIILDLFVKGENTHSALLQIDATHIVSFISGMSSAYCLDLEEVAAEAEAESTDMNEIIEMAEEWTLPEDLAGVIEAHEGDFTITELGPRTDENGVEMEYVSISGSMNAVIYDMLKLIGNDALCCEIFYIVDPEIDPSEFADEFAEEGIEYILDGEAGVDSTGNIMSMQYTISMYEENAAEPFGVAESTAFCNLTDPDACVYSQYITMYDGSANVIGEMSYDVEYSDEYFSMFFNETKGEEYVDGNMYVYYSDTYDSFDLYMTGSDEYTDSATISISATNEKSSNGFNCGAVMTYDEAEFSSTITFLLSAETTDGVTAFDGSLEITDNSEFPYAGIFVTGSSEPDAGAFDCTFSADDGVSKASLSLQLVPSEPAAGMEYTGKLIFGADDGFTAVEIAADVNVFTAQVDTDKFYIDPADAINLMEMTDNQAAVLFSELDAVCESIMDVLEKAYPLFFSDAF